MRTLSAATVVVGCLLLVAGCGTSEPAPTPAPDPVIDWITGEPTVPTDPRELAVWNWNIEDTYAFNTSNFARHQYADAATHSVIAGAIGTERNSLVHSGGVGAYTGPSPIVFVSVDDGDGLNTAIVTYCATELWDRYDGLADTQTDTGFFGAATVTRGDDGRWRVEKMSTSAEACSLEGAAIGYFVPRPEPKAPGTYSVDDLVVPTWFEEENGERS